MAKSALVTRPVAVKDPVTVGPVKVAVAIVGEVARTIPLVPVEAAARAVATPVPSPVIPLIGSPVPLVRVREAGVPIARPFGSVVLIDGTPPPLVTSTPLFAVPRPVTVVPAPA